MKRLLLIGAGHAHAQVLLDWEARPVRGVELMVLSPHGKAPYSGMVPGWLAGTYDFDAICIDFAGLAQRAGAVFVEGALYAIDPTLRRVHLASGATIDYDLVSLNVGSTLTPPRIDGPPVLSLRPLGDLKTAWDRVLNLPAKRSSVVPHAVRVTAVGGGAAGFESVLAVVARLRALNPGQPVHADLVTRGTQWLPGLAPGAVRSAERALRTAGVQLHLGTAWTPAMADNTDLLIWGTGAQAHAWQTDTARSGGLAVSAQGFIRVQPDLRSVSHPDVYAVGDCAEWASPLPKAGVYAVRMGPVLSRNLRTALGDEGGPVDFKPQHHFMGLLATANGRAIASRGRLHAEGRWVWRLKDRIDRGFLARFQSPAVQRGLV